MTLIAPLNIEYLFINVLSGSIMIFIGLALFFIAIQSAKFRMPNIIFGMMVVLFGILIASIAGWIYITVLIIVGLAVGYTMTRIQR